MLLGYTDVESLSKDLDAVEVCDGSVHSILISHLNQCCTRNALHELNLLNIAIEAKEVEDSSAIHLGWMEATNHGNRAGGMARIGGG